MKLHPVALACLGMAASPTPVLAADTLPALSVTAKGYAADDMETPAATFALSRDDLQQRAAGNVGDALRGEPGLAVSGDSAQGQNPVIRGLKKESVVLLVDGIRVNAAQPAGAIASFMSLPLAESVEVVRGPASVLYGSGALGGAINVRLPHAHFAPGVGFDTALAWNSASRGLRATGVMNAAGADQALMLGASLSRIGDYDAPDGRVGRTGYDSDSFIGQYRFRVDAANELRVSLQQHTDEDVWYPGSTKPHPHPLVQSTTVHSPRQERVLAEVGYRRKGSGETPVNFDLRAYRQEVKREIFSYADGPLARDIAETRVTFVTDGIDARADWLAHPLHLVSFGANAWRTSASPERLLPAPATNPANPLGRSDPFTNGRIEALGLYVQDDMRFGKLGVLAGLRHDTVEGDADSVGSPPVTQNLARRDGMWSGALAAIYEVAPLVRPYANLSRGVRAGEMRERFESSPRGDGFFYVGNPQIEPETATQIELGLKGATTRFDYRMAVYRTRIDDYITGLDISGTAEAVAVCGPANATACKRTVNLGQVTLEGLEAEGRWQFVDGHWLSAGLSMVRGTNEDLDEPLFQMPADELDLGWEGRVAPEWTLDTTLRLVRRQDRVATVFARGSEDPTAGFATVDVGATWRRGKHSVRVAMRNLADKAYHEHLTEGVSGQEIPAPGRSLDVVYSGKF